MMSLVYAALSPHPPLLVPEVGGSAVNTVKNSADALSLMAEELVNKKPDTLLMITPHGPVFADALCILADKEISGDLSNFGAGSVNMKFEIDTELARDIYKKETEAGFKVVVLNEDVSRSNFINYTVDHALMVPLYYLKEKGFCSKLLPMTFSLWSFKQLFDFGKVISGIIKKSPKKIALVASGDLSHRLTPDAPAGYNEKGRVFDELLVKLLGEYKVNDILNMDTNLIEQAGECGLRPIIMMLGMLSNFNVKPKVLSYEGPFGVGYAVIKFDVE
ncbi:MAG: AmmeMemoRadiSam system protein B [Armatimonadota bacterium]